MQSGMYVIRQMLYENDFASGVPFYISNTLQMAVRLHLPLPRRSAVPLHANDLKNEQSPSPLKQSSCALQTLRLLV